MTPLDDRAVEQLRTIVGRPATPGDRYVVHELIARGGMGEVYRAVDTSLGRDVALKVLPLAAAPGMAERLEREARVLARLEHPGIVPVHDVGALDDGRLYYVMRLVRGRRLDEYSRDGPTRGELLRVFLRLCDAVAFAHAQGVIHRDLKPGNIMIGPFGEVLVLDWGVARVLSDGARRRRRCLTRRRTRRAVRRRRSPSPPRGRSSGRQASWRRSRRRDSARAPTSGRMSSRSA